jgi:hypothetical protein
MRSGREPARFLKLEITMLGSGFILVGAAMFAIWLFLRKKAKATGQWPSTRGRVVASDVYLNRSTEGPGMEEVRVTYDYAVAGATLRGNRISMGGSGSGGIKAQFARYQAGAEVDVFYDPNKPASAVLERNLPGKLIVLPIVGTAFLIAGALFIL